MQALVQSSVSTVLPSSQASPASLTPLPQSGPLHLLLQPSVSMRLPSSQSSAADMGSICTRPSPQTASVHSLVQASRATLFPSSHSSPLSSSTSPLPQFTPGGGVGVGISSSSPQAIIFIASSGTTTHRAADLGLRLITYPPRVQYTQWNEGPTASQLLNDAVPRVN